MKRFILINCIFLMFISISHNTFSYDIKDDEKTLSIVTPIWDDWTNKDETGFYFELINLIYKPLGYKTDISFTPFARAFRLIELKKADLMFSLYSRDENSEVLTSQHPIDAGTVLIIFDNKLSWNGMSSLHKQNVIMPRAYKYHQYITEDFTPMEIKDSEQGMAMFLHGRAPYFVTHYVEMLKLQKEHNIDPTKYRTEVLMQRNLHVGYAKTEKGAKLREIFDKKMSEIIQNGVIEKLYKKWNIKQLVNFQIDTPNSRTVVL